VTGETQDAGGSRAARAGRAALPGLAAGAVLGLLDALRCRLDPTSVVPPSSSPLVVLLYASTVALPAAAAGALLSRATAAALVLAGAAALGAGLAANHYLLPAFTDPLSLGGDAAILAAAAAGAFVLRRRFVARGAPGPRAATAAAAVAFAASLLLALGGGRDDGPAPAARRTATGPTPDVLLVVVDTLRADAPAFSGAPGAAPTPHMDALAKEGAVFTVCRAPSSWTKPSTASLLTGLYPSEHGALGFESVLPGEASTLAEVLRAAGWRTAAFADNPFVSPEFGFAQGFDAFTGRHPSPLARGTLLLRSLSQVRLRVAGGAAYSFGPGVDLGAPRVLGDAVRFLCADPRPGFAYCHLIEPHYPYTPPPPFDGGRPRVDPPHSSGILPFDSFPEIPAEDAAIMKANYLGEVRAADAALGDALEALRRAGRLENTLVVLTSDHGEEFHEHGGWTHGQSLYEELVRVPLVVRTPKGGPGAGRRVDTAVSLVDLFPTILDLAGVASSTGNSGGSLRPLLRGEDVIMGPQFAEISAGPVGARAGFMFNEAFIVSRKAGRTVEQLFHLGRDPGQRHDLRNDTGEPGKGALYAGLLEKAFLSMESGGLRRENRAFDEATRKALEAIGYTGK
jgi:arylsulfatase A-like enzyme